MATQGNRPQRSPARPSGQTEVRAMVEGKAGGGVEEGEGEEGRVGKVFRGQREVSLPQSRMLGSTGVTVAPHPLCVLPR